MSDQIIATYLIETSHPLNDAAAILAGEQSSGTFVKTPGESKALMLGHRARIESIQTLEEVPRPSLPHASKYADQPILRARLKVSWPLHNMGINLPMLYTTVAGNLFELSPFSALRLLDIQLPLGFAKKYRGPRFSVDRTRSLCQVYDRPIIGTIIKPSVGLKPEETADLCSLLMDAGLDFIKDDELQGDSSHSPFSRRVTAVMKAINHYADRTGKKPMYAFNVSGGIDEMKRKHDLVLEHGGTCIMVNINWVGLAGVIEMARHSQLPIHGHRCGWGLFSRSPHIGIAFPAYQKMWRLAGIDHLHTNGLRNKFCEDDETVIESIKSCLSPFIDLPPLLPVLSSGQWAGQVHDTYQAIGSKDLMYLCGGGIMAHPMGIKAGVQSIKQAWDAALNQISLMDFAKDHQELASALQFFGTKGQDGK